MLQLMPGLSLFMVPWGEFLPYIYPQLGNLGAGAIPIPINCLPMSWPAFHMI